MALVVLLRGVNLGGKRFRPSALAKEIDELDVVSIGAAGTFVVRGATTRSALRAEFADRLPFEAEVMVCAARDLATLAESSAIPTRLPRDATLHLTVLAKAPRSRPELPLEAPDAGAWQVRVLAAEKRFVVSCRRRTDDRLVYPNEVIEREFGVPATTRTWATVEKILAAAR